MLAELRRAVLAGDDSAPIFAQAAEAAGIPLAGLVMFGPCECCGELAPLSPVDLDDLPHVLQLGGA